MSTAKTSHTTLLTKIGTLPFGSFYVFVIKQAWAALFGGLMLAAIVFTYYVDLPWLARYDWLLIFALLIQAFMLLTRLEQPHEIITIFAFHLVGLGMELFKTSSAINSWSYPEAALFKVGNVPLFSGFMYAAVGSYIARSWRIFSLQFTPYPRRLYTVLLAVAIYVNFFTHHFLPDIRYLLFAGFAALYWRTWVHFTVNKRVHRMPLMLGVGCIAFFIWVAENVATFAHVWLYPNQVAQWHLVGLSKLGSWLLLLIISFIMVDLLHYARARALHKKLSQTAV